MTDEHELWSSRSGASSDLSLLDVGTDQPLRRISLLGELRVSMDGELRPVTGPKQRAVLAHLALEPGVAHSADRLLDAIWGEKQPSGGAKAVAFQITKLRDALEPERQGEGTMIRTTSAGYVLDMDARDVDIHDVTAAIDDASAALRDDAAKACAIGTDALARWRGQPFADIPASPAVDDERRRMDLLLLRCQSLVLEARIDLGEHAEVLADVAHLAARNPLDEHLTSLHATALDRSGRTADALRVISDLRTQLRDDLGLDPSPEIAELELALLDRQSTVVRPRLTAAGVGLPVPVTSLVGREEQAIDVLGSLDDVDCRVLTLLGPGGVGKTRLAIEAASRWRATHDEPVWYCALAGVAAGSSIPDVVAAAVGFVVDDHAIAGSGMDNRMQVLDYLATRDGLLVADNAEHLDEVPSLIADIAERCPGIAVLVTSRERLAISAEWISIVSGLTTAGTDAPAARLFATRAQQAGARLSAPDRDHIGRICKATEGLPLAIELAAAMAGTCPVSDVAAQFEHHATSFESDALDIDERHRSLHAAFTHSWHALDGSLQESLAALSVFPAPFDTAAAQVIAGAGSSTLGRLVMKSLLRRVGPDTFDLHPLIRQFGETKLGDRAGPFRAAHSRHYLGRIAALTQPLLGSAEQAEAAAQVDAEIEHVRGAAAWLAGHVRDPEVDELLTAAVHALSAHGFIRSLTAWSQTLTAVADGVEAAIGPEEAASSAAYIWARVYHCYPDAMMEGKSVETTMRTLEPAAAALSPKALAWCLTNQAICAELGGDVEAALALMERAAEVDAGDDALLVAVVTSWHGWELSLMGRHAEADAIWKHGLEFVTAAQNQTARGYMLSKVGLAADDLGNHDLALHCHRESMEIFGATGDNGGLGYTLSRISWTQRMLGNFDEAIAAADEGLERFRAVNHRWGIGASLGRRAHASLDAGHPVEAAADFSECIGWGERKGLPSIVWYGLVGIGMTLASTGQDEPAVELLAHAMAVPGNPYAQPFARPGLDELASRMPAETYSDAVRRGEALSMEEAKATALDCARSLAF